MSDITAAKIGDKRAGRERHDRWGSAPHINHTLYVVSKVTATQVVAVKEGNSHYELRFRRSDGGQIGSLSRYSGAAEMATTELMQQHLREVSDRNRWHAAVARMTPVEAAVGKRALTVEQMEAIATAYESTIEQAPA